MTLYNITFMRYLFQIKNKLTKNKAHHIKILAQKQ